jgi:predicted membrane chloride channel (bestrophin family)
MRHLLRKWGLSLKVLPLALAAMGVKYLLHLSGWEVITLNALFPGLLAATVFLLGFLVSGVLADYKESEKLPGELAVSLEALADEAAFIWKGKHAAAARDFLGELAAFADAIRGWFCGTVGTPGIMARVTALDDHFLALEPHTQAPFLLRMKQEQSAIRRVLVRVNAIRETSFIRSGYAIAEAVSALIVLALVLARIEPFYESLFFVAIVTYLLTYMLALIRDLDDPFEYAPDGSSGGDEVSLQPLLDAEQRLRQRLEILAP